MGYMDLALSYSKQMKVVEAPASGGGLSQNGKFSYGYASSAGKRSSMEDFFETRVDGIDGEIVGLFGVFDGHGGARAAEYVKRHLFSNLITHPKFISDTKSAIADAYTHTDSELLKSENSHTRDAGSTASTAILVGDRLLVANVGDSRAVICRGGNAFAVSRDHKPDQSDERERIENAGGFVMWAGTWRVGGVLAVSRAFGDRLLKQYVVADPEIQEEKIDDSLEFLILASDGLWDVFSNEEAVSVVKEVEDPEESTKKLVGEAIKRGSADNITCVVVRFLESKTGNNKASDVSSTHASSSGEANRGQTTARNDVDHKISAKETNQEHTTAHNDLDSNTENQNLNQKPVAARNDLDHNKNSAKETSQEHTSAHRDSASKSLSQNPVAPINSLDHKISANETNQKHTTAHCDLDRNAGDENLNQKPVTAKNDLDHKIPAKETNQKHTTAHRDLDRNAKNENLNQKPVAARNNDSDRTCSNQKPNAIAAAGHSISSEQGGSAGKKNQMPIKICSGSEPKSSSKHPDQGQTTVYNSQNQAIAATHTPSSEQSRSTDEKNQKPISVHNDSSTSKKASSLYSMTN